MDIFDSKGTANNLPINLIVSFDIISFLFFDNNLTTSAKIKFTDSSLSSSGQHFIVKLRKATCNSINLFISMAVFAFFFILLIFSLPFLYIFCF